MEKTVVITGAAGNLGRAVTKKFLTLNYRVIATVEPEHKEDAEALTDLAGGAMLGGKAQLELHTLNMTNEVADEHFVSAISDRHDHIDAALMLVGGFSMGNITQTAERDLDKMLSLNFKTAYLVSRPIFKQMLTQPQGGRLVFIGARPALDASAGKVATGYALAKSLLFKLSELLNAEGAVQNVVSTVVVPSTIDTPQNRKSMPDADFSAWVTPEDVAEVIAFACTDAGLKLRDPVLKVYGKA